MALPAPVESAAFWQSVPQGGGAAQVARITLDRDVYDCGGRLEGQIHFARPPLGPIQVQWSDSFGRVAGELELPAPDGAARPLRFSFDLRAGLAYSNWIGVKVNGETQAVAKSFLLAPRREPWEDFHVITWAHYRDGVYDLLRRCGIDGTIASREGQALNVIDNNFRFYVEQMVPDIFSIYIRNAKLWYGVVNSFSTDRENLKLWVRQPCLNDPKTNQEIHERLTRYVRQHKALRPLFYNIADELGQGWQIKANDFCHSPHCTAKFAGYLRSKYGTPERVGQEWGIGGLTRWDDESQAGPSPSGRRLMIDYTTTDGAFDGVAVAALQERFGTVARLNEAWGTSLPDQPRDPWRAAMAIIREARAVSKLDETSLEQKLGSLQAADERWGGGAGRPAIFRNWTEVVAFVNRFYTELPKLRSTEGWNVAAWCDFRNFMDETFADAVHRAALACKAEDPDALCATEGGQSPFPFGWYNYEQVLRAVDVIEPYNGGNNVEIIRSLKPGTIILNTVGYQYKAGQPLTDRNRLVQKQARRPVWWGLFHGHRGSIIWDNNLPDYQFVNSDTREATPAAETYSGVFSELRRGIGKLFINVGRKHDGIAIHYSPASDQVHWLLDNFQYARQWMIRNGSDRRSRAIAVRNSWTKMVEDLGLQYQFASSGQVRAGELAGGEYRVFIMPQSIAVGTEEAARIREFVRSGGVLIGDSRAAQINEHGRDLGYGGLDDVFGISRTKAQAAGDEVRGVADDGTLRLAGKPLRVRVGQAGIAVTQGKALARSGGVPLVIVNHFGQGRAIFLNLEVGDYCYERLQADSDRSLPDLLESILDSAGIRPAVRVLGKDGKRLPGTEVVVFGNGPVEHVAISRNPQFDDGGWEEHPTMTAPGWAGSIDNSLLEKDAEVTIEWAVAQQTYDLRKRADLGSIKTWKGTLNPWAPLVFTRSPRPVPTLNAEIPPRVSPGSVLELRLRNRSTFPGGARVVRLELETPSGQPYELYCRNILFKSEAHTEEIPLARNDPKGRWRARIHDVVTGHSQELSFEVG
ncbi:MAG: beta-galactosidase trimerization domain-containing protein [Acidobacteria bacterium]|nr:beta-galactosidase trimerization domain-containing protein [Acidobacteriota bacterium]